MLEKKFLNPSDLANWSQHFTQVITVHNGSSKTAYISGQVGVDENKNLVGDGDLSAQAMQAFKNLEKALAAAGATTADVVKVNIYVKNYQADNAAVVTQAYRQCFPFQHLPTSTWIGVQSLAKEDFLIEVDAIAVFE